MDIVLVRVKQKQLKAQQELLSNLADFQPLVIPTQIDFPASDLAFSSNIEHLAQRLPTTDRKMVTAAKCLYRFDTDDFAQVISTYEAYSRLSSKQIPALSLSRYNKVSKAGSCLYVGSSSLAGLRTRFKQHCGFYQGQDRTYSLKLAKWLTKNAAPITVVFSYWELPDIDQEVLQLLEDGL